MEVGSGEPSPAAQPVVSADPFGADTPGRCQNSAMRLVAAVLFGIASCANMHDYRQGGVVTETRRSDKMSK
jgi:hypothetical protein